MNDARASILLVDDDESLLASLRRRLVRRKPDWTLQTQHDPLAALKVLENRQFDAVVVDFRMPAMNGVDLASELKRQDPETATIMLTGSGDYRLALAAINDAGVHKFIEKPCNTDDLVSALESAVAASRALRAALPNLPSPPEDVQVYLSSRALDHLTIGVIGCARDARVLFANAQARSLFAEKDGLLLDAGDTCRGATPTETAAIHKAIRAAVETNATNYETLERSAQRRPLSVCISPLPENEHAAAMALLLVSPLDRALTPSTEAIKRIFKLTDSEAMIAHRIAIGDTLNEAAERAGVTISTARTYMKRILAKTQTSKQTELVRLLHAVPVTFK